MISDAYLALKLLHILSAVSLFGIGVGTAFHLYVAHRRNRPDEIAAAANSAVMADLLFTLPAAIVQPVTGIALVLILGYRLSESWLVAAYVLYAIAIACWVAAFFLQHSIRAFAQAAVADRSALPPGYAKAMGGWVALGWAALACFLVIFGLMTFKPDMIGLGALASNRPESGGWQRAALCSNIDISYVYPIGISYGYQDNSPAG